jgi:small subunit ribosomal protein S6
MNKYETIIIVDPKLDDEACNQVGEKFSNMITSAKGTVESVEAWGKRKLAYPIEKNSEGFYIKINFNSEPEFVEELTRVYNITDEVIKHIVVKLD